MSKVKLICSLVDGDFVRRVEPIFHQCLFSTLLYYLLIIIKNKNIICCPYSNCPLQYVNSSLFQCCIDLRRDVHPVAIAHYDSEAARGTRALLSHALVRGKLGQ